MFKYLFFSGDKFWLNSYAKFTSYLKKEYKINQSMEIGGE